MCWEVSGFLPLLLVSIRRFQREFFLLAQWIFSERKLVYFDIFNINKTWDIFSKGKVVDTKNYKLIDPKKLHDSFWGNSSLLYGQVSLDFVTENMLKLDPRSWRIMKSAGMRKTHCLWLLGLWDGCGLVK